MWLLSFIVLDCEQYSIESMVLGGFVLAYLIFILFALLVSKMVGKYISNSFYSMPGIRYAAQRISGNPFWISFQISALGVAMLALLLLIVIRFNVLELLAGKYSATSQ
jgi:predicted lysophospholipase L1 biosynthesis ABC-type transport system permease subunit